MHPITQTAIAAGASLSFFGLAASADHLGREWVTTGPPSTAITSAHALTLDISAPCAEDDQCWRWSSMGNHMRGVLIRGERRPVSACTYRKLVLAGIVKRSDEPLRGDAWAIAHGCGDGATLSMHPTGIVAG